MKKIILPTLLAIISVFPCIASAKIPLLYENPRIGMELGQRILKWEDGMGKDHFAQSFPQLGVFVELPILEQFSIKVGHEETVKRNSLVNYADGSKVLNYNIMYDTKYYTSTKLIAGYIDAAYNFTLLKRKNYKTQIVFSLGYVKGKLKLEQLATIEGIPDTLYNLSSKKAFLHHGIAIQTIFKNDFIISLGLMHEQTSKFQSSALIHNPLDIDDIVGSYNIKAKNSLIYKMSISYAL